MTIKVKKILTTVLVALSLLAFACAFTCFNELSTALGDGATYVSPIPAGYYVQSEYDVLDVTAKDLGETNSALSQELGNARVARFKYVNKVGTSWSMDIGMFATTNAYGTNSNEGCFYFAIPNSNTKNISLSIVSAKQSAHNTQTFDCPDFINLNTVGESHNVEVGALDVTDGTSTVAGKNGVLIYMDIDGVRVAEYHYTQYPTLPFGGDNFWVVENPTSTRGIDVTAYDLSATSLTDKTNVSFSEESYDCAFTPATPIPVITAIVEKNGVSYGQVVEPKYYDVAYTNNDKAGNATATITFKGKYSGTTSATFTTTNAFEDYTDILPEGYYIEDYEVADLATAYGENNSITYTGNASSDIFDNNGYKAVRLKTTYTVKSAWEQNFILFSGASLVYASETGKGMMFFTIGNTPSRYGVIKLNIRSGSAQVNDTPVQEFAHPSWLSANAGQVHNVEYGAPAVYDAQGNYKGILCYLEINGVRLAEYFYQNSTLKFEGGKIAYNANSTNVAITPFDQVTALDETTVKTSVLTNYVSEDGVMVPEFDVIGAIVKEGKTYVQRIEKSNYTVNCGEVTDGKATVTITFKEKYSGSISQIVDVVEAINASGAVVTLSNTLYSKDVNDNPITPIVVAVDLNGKAIKRDCYTVSYENNVNPGTAKVIVTFKNGFYGSVITLFKINPILTENHIVDSDPVIMDLAEVYGGEEKRIEVGATGVYETTSLMSVALGEAEVVRFKITFDPNLNFTTIGTGSHYFSLFSGDKYYLTTTGHGLVNFSIPYRPTIDKVNMSIRNHNGLVVGSYSNAKPANFDIRSSINVEIGALKINYNDDGEIDYVGRLFYIKLDGVTALEYVYFNDSLLFEEGNLIINGNTDSFVIEQYDYVEPGTENENNGLSSNGTASTLEFNGNLGGFSQAEAVATQTNTKNYTLIIILTVVFTLAIITIVGVKVINRKK